MTIRLGLHENNVILEPDTLMGQIEAILAKVTNASFTIHRTFDKFTLRTICVIEEGFNLNLEKKN